MTNERITTLNEQLKALNKEFKRSGLTLEEWSERLDRIEEKRFYNDFTDLEE